MTAAISLAVSQPVTVSPALRAACAIDDVVCCITVNAPVSPPPACEMSRLAALRSREIARYVSCGAAAGPAEATRSA